MNLRTGLRVHGGIVGEMLGEMTTHNFYCVGKTWLPPNWRVGGKPAREEQWGWCLMGSMLSSPSGLPTSPYNMHTPRILGLSPYLYQWRPHCYAHLLPVSNLPFLLPRRPWQWLILARLLGSWLHIEQHWRTKRQWQVIVWSTSFLKWRTGSSGEVGTVVCSISTMGFDTEFSNMHKQPAWDAWRWWEGTHK